jgi:hypothetical protein
MIKNTYMRYMFLILTIVAVNARAQTDEAGIRKVVDNLFPE